MGVKVFTELKSNLSRHSDLVTLRETGAQLSIKPIGPNTFPILVVDDGREMMISALRWHTREDSAEQTVACVMWLLTSFYRIVETERRGIFVMGRLEKFEPPGQWTVESETGPLFRSFGWKHHQVRIAYQQNVLPCPPAFLKQFAPGALDESGIPIGSQLGNHALDQ
jgi:hypothetical protein